MGHSLADLQADSLADRLASRACGCNHQAISAVAEEDEKRERARHIAAEPSLMCRRAFFWVKPSVGTAQSRASFRSTSSSDRDQLITPQTTSTFVPLSDVNVISAFARDASVVRSSRPKDFPERLSWSGGSPHPLSWT